MNIPGSGLKDGRKAMAYVTGQEKKVEDGMMVENEESCII